MEKQTIKKVGKSQYGLYAQLGDDSFKGITEQVNKFLEGKTPCQIEIEETIGKGKDEKISRVRVLGQTQTVGQEMRQEAIDKAVKQKQASVMISYAKDLAVAGIINPDEIAKWSSSFVSLQEELVKGNI